MSNKKVNPKIKVSVKTKKQNKVLLKFLRQTKNGKYAEIEKSSIRYTRWGQDFEVPQSDQEEYYYGLS